MPEENSHLKHQRGHLYGRVSAQWCAVLFEGFSGRAFLHRAAADTTLDRGGVKPAVESAVEDDRFHLREVPGGGSDSGTRSRVARSNAEPNSP